MGALSRNRIAWNARVSTRLILRRPVTLLQRLASPAEAGVFEPMAKSLHDELAAVSKELADLTETTRIEWERAMGEGHAWTDPEHNDFVTAFEESSGRLVELL